MFLPTAQRHPLLEYLQAALYFWSAGFLFGEFGGNAPPRLAKMGVVSTWQRF